MLTISELSITGSVNQPSCNPSNGLSNGEIRTTTLGGERPYSYRWSTNTGSGLEATDMNQSQLGEGVYLVTVTDANGCTGTASFDLAYPSIISILSSATDPSCAINPDGVIDISVTGGNDSQGYDYLWTTTDGGGLNPGVEDQSGLSSGTYTLVVTDGNGCTQSDVYRLKDPAEIPPEETSSTICESETPYEWNGQQLESTGVYTHLEPTTNGCEKEVILNLTVLQSESGERELIETCQSSLPITWNGEQYSAAGEYEFEVINDNGCNTKQILELVVFSETADIATSETICEIDLPYLRDGIELPTAGSYEYILRDGLSLIHI